VTRSLRFRVLGACIAIATGILFAVLPEQWIELRTDWRPDGGSGLLELLLAAIPIAAGILLAGLIKAPLLDRNPVQISLHRDARKCVDVASGAGGHVPVGNHADSR
jgi:hypothetical protein